MLINH